MDDYEAGLLANAAKNRTYTKPGNYLTQLDPKSEAVFRQWVAQNKVPFNPDVPLQDYDMRGFWKGLQTKDPHASTGKNANDGQLHFSDWWKTPYHASFSAESQWAKPTAPTWNDKDQLVLANGKVVFDERANAAQQKIVEGVKQ